MGDKTEANIERVLSRVEQLGPRIESSDHEAEEKTVLLVNSKKIFYIYEIFGKKKNNFKNIPK